MDDSAYGGSMVFELGQRSFLLIQRGSVVDGCLEKAELLYWKNRYLLYSPNMELTMLQLHSAQHSPGVGCTQCSTLCFFQAR
mmetsp:Transcript_33182/g.53814  ORF Transcript_33182/g.53814 Transcript_33182/m.53814 type:complete len:82 (+) Transcript_33182:542-787(+)